MVATVEYSPKNFGCACVNLTLYSLNMQKTKQCATVPYTVQTDSLYLPLTVFYNPRGSWRVQSELASTLYVSLHRQVRLMCCIRLRVCPAHLSAFKLRRGRVLRDGMVEG